jgi:hypothetical protein
MEITQNKFNKIKWKHNSYGKQWELKQIYFLARDKAIKSNSQCKDDQYICTHDRVPIVQVKKYLELFLGGSLCINPRSSSQQRSI